MAEQIFKKIKMPNGDLYDLSGGEGTSVIPNPEGEATESLEKIQIGDDIFKVEGGEGTSVIPNPEGEATENLEKIKIGDDIFKVEGGGSSIDLHVIGKNWSNETEYSKNDFVVYNDKLWKSLLDNNLNNTPTEGLYWTETNIGDELKETDPTVPDWAKEPNKPSYDGTEIEYDNSETKFEATNVSEAIDELFTKTVGTVGTAVENYVLLGEIPAWTSTVDLKGHRSFYLIGAYDGPNKLSKCCGGFYFDLDFEGQLRLLSDDERRVIYNKFYDQYRWDFYPMNNGWIRKEGNNQYRCYWASGSGYGTINLTVNEDGTVTVGQSYSSLGGIIVYKQSGIGNAYMTPFELTIINETDYGYLDADRNFHKFGESDGYIKPDDGIPKSDLNQSVQDSLDKAETALQSFTEEDPTVPAHVKSITETDISNWNDKAEKSEIPSVPDWALEETKPTYTASEVRALPDDTVIPEQLTEADILDMGFTKNTGTYIKPESGIPKSDLSEDVQDSLDKAETDPTVPAHVKSITETDISNWNDKQDKLTAGDGIDISDGIISSTIEHENKWIGTQEDWDALDKDALDEETVVYITDDYDIDPVAIDDHLSLESTNPVQNKVVTQALLNGGSGLSGVVCCIGDSFTEGTSGGFQNDIFEPLDNYSTVRTNQSLFRSFPWWIAKENPGLTVKNFSLGQSVITRGNTTTSFKSYNKCFAVGTEDSYITDNFSYQNIPYADVYFIQFGINDSQAQKDGYQMGLKESLSLTNKLLLEKSFIDNESYRTESYCTDFSNPTYSALTFVEGFSAIVNMCRIKNRDAKIVWLISEWTIDHATYNTIVTMCNFHGIEYIDMVKVNGSIATNRKDVTIEGNYSASVTPSGDSFVVSVTEKSRSGVLGAKDYISIDSHPTALAHEKKGKWLSTWLKHNM